MCEVSDITLEVSGMTCGHCVSAITGEVQKVAGVETVRVSLDERRVTVRGSHVDEAAVREAIEEAGYEVAS